MTTASLFGQSIWSYQTSNPHVANRPSKFKILFWKDCIILALFVEFQAMNILFKAIWQEVEHSPRIRSPEIWPLILSRCSIQVKQAIFNYIENGRSIPSVGENSLYSSKCILWCVVSCVETKPPYLTGSIFCFRSDSFGGLSFECLKATAKMRTKARIQITDGVNLLLVWIELLDFPERKRILKKLSLHASLDLRSGFMLPVYIYVLSSCVGLRLRCPDTHVQI